jgi:hypothetical protein
VSKLPDTRSPSGPVTTSVLRRYVSAFGHFWWEFLVGDTPELLVGAVLAVGIVALLAHQGVARAVTVGSLPVLVVAMLGASVRRAQRAARGPHPQRQPEPRSPNP